MLFMLILRISSFQHRRHMELYFWLKLWKYLYFRADEKQQPHKQTPTRFPPTGKNTSLIGNGDVKHQRLPPANKNSSLVGKPNGDISNTKTNGSNKRHLSTIPKNEGKIFVLLLLIKWNNKRYQVNERFNSCFSNCKSMSHTDIGNSTEYNPYHMRYKPQKPIIIQRADIGRGWYSKLFGFWHA